jgi:YidC/Oxa1 family membrane protein insertase
MERRLILAIFLSFVVLFLYQLVFIKPQKITPKSPERLATVQQTEPKEKKPEQAEQKVQTAENQTTFQGEIIVAQQEEALTIDTPLYTAVWSNRGGVLKSWKLKHHLKRLPTKKEPEKEPLDLVPETAQKTGLFPFSLQLDEPELTEKLNNALYRVKAGKLTVNEGEKSSLIFEYSDGNTVKSSKEFVFNGKDYSFEIKSRVEVLGKEVESLYLWGPGISTLTPEELKQKFSASRGAAFLSGNKVLRLQEKKIGLESEAIRYASPGWASYEENYFAAVFLLDSARSQAFAFRKDLSEEQADGKTVVFPYFYLAFSRPTEAYIGPKEYDRLVAYGHQTKKIINFGFFGGIAEIILAATKYFHKFLPNWGLAIIIMTLIIKILFFPLTYSSTKSMAKMQEIQPKIKALQAKYKKAKQDIGQRQKMNEELMRLYKEHGINPASGCLPLLIQLPVFWGFFRMLVVAVEFRHSPFVFWITDLSVRDPYYVTPILMGVTQYISQKMTPSTADQTQQKMMLLMPFIFTIFFMNFQSGLVLYWLTNNVLQIGQQAIMNRIMARERETDGKRRKK